MVYFINSLRMILLKKSISHFFSKENFLYIIFVKFSFFEKMIYQHVKINREQQHKSDEAVQLIFHYSSHL